MSYDPSGPPDPGWSALSQDAKVELVLAHHADPACTDPRTRPEAGIHAGLHVQVEDRALGDAHVAATLARLVGEGLDRHAAVHAVATALDDHMQAVTRALGEGVPPLAAALDQLSARDWRKRERDDPRRAAQRDARAAKRRQKQKRKRGRR